MTGSSEVLALLSAHGLAILAPLAVIEGPIVTVIAAWLASLGVLDLVQVIVCVIIADLVGDSILFAFGRLGLSRLPEGWRLRAGLSRRRMEVTGRLFRKRGMRILIIGKLTHALGFVILIAAGAARMNYGSFLLANFVATVPKSLALVALGYLAGAAHARIGEWLFWASLLGLGILAWMAMRVIRRRVARA